MTNTSAQKISPLTLTPHVAGKCGLFDSLPKFRIPQAVEDNPCGVPLESFGKINQVAFSIEQRAFEAPTLPELADAVSNGIRRRIGQLSEEGEIAAVFVFDTSSPYVDRLTVAVRDGLPVFRATTIFSVTYK